ncbi:acetoacetate--CoA ligase [Pseudonocardia spinosispora]|uniref:acetoacetate--CoA ligase n=1 Tax=Pseudonocardia spinosispora TaxID=103441 RepID=UPI00040F5A32|nr:acetoacetate--CoA ligase [Pseudonocardia spinosispora]
MPDEDVELLWSPDPERADASALADFTRWVGEHRNVTAADYQELHNWSITDVPGFWGALAEYSGVRWHDQPTEVLASRQMPGAQWFPGGTLNYAEHALNPSDGGAEDDIAVIFVREDGLEREVTYGDMREQVARARAGLQAAGVGKGDRVVALAPNCVQTLVAFLATASLGAIWSSCSPDFGSRAVHDRFAQIEPTVLVAVDGYTYGGKSYDIRPTVDALRGQLPTVRQTVLVPYVDTDAALDGTISWDDFTAEKGELAFEPVPFDHPLWVLYSSGTTGLPKGIVHGHGGIVLEHIKAIRLHFDIGPGDRLFWFTTTGWMMWNLVISGLLVGGTVVLYDGSPAYPDLNGLWAMAQRHRVSVFGTSAGWIQACLKKGLRPRDDYDLSSIRALGSTGSPLSSEGFRWIADAVDESIQIVSCSGGTDLCAAFVGGAPTVPVWLGEISCPALGAAVKAYDEDGKELVEQVGELVVTEPMPSMPVYFWNDPDGDRLREAYFDEYPGIWRHGDWIKITARGSSIIYGRSDSTLNRGGVRMGTADFYAVVEGFDEVADSLVIDTTQLASDGGELLCFLVLAPGAELSAIEPSLRSALRKELSPRHVPDRFILIDEVPRTLNGKKCEVPVKKILSGFAVEKAVSRGALANPAALDPFIALVSAS